MTQILMQIFQNRFLLESSVSSAPSATVAMTTTTVGCECYFYYDFSRIWWWWFYNNGEYSVSASTSSYKYRVSLLDRLVSSLRLRLLGYSWCGCWWFVNFFILNFLFVFLIIFVVVHDLSVCIWDIFCVFWHDNQQRNGECKTQM